MSGVYFFAVPRRLVKRWRSWLVGNGLTYPGLSSSETDVGWRRHDEDEDSQRRWQTTPLNAPAGHLTLSTSSRNRTDRDPTTTLPTRNVSHSKTYLNPHSISTHSKAKLYLFWCFNNCRCVMVRSQPMRCCTAPCGACCRFARCERTVL